MKYSQNKKKKRVLGLPSLKPTQEGSIFCIKSPKTQVNDGGKIAQQQSLDRAEGSDN